MRLHFQVSAIGHLVQVFRFGCRARGWNLNPFPNPYL